MGGLACLRRNKQLFLNEIVFRFRKDIVSPRKPGVVIYSPRKVSGCRGFVVTCIGYYRKLILPFHFASGEGVLPYICYIGMCALKGYGFLEILVRKRVSALVILASTLEREPAQPRPLGFKCWGPKVQLSTFDLHNGSWSSMNDNFAENGVLFTPYLMLKFSISVLPIEWMLHISFCCLWRSIFSFQKGSRKCDDSCDWIICPLLLE